MKKFVVVLMLLSWTLAGFSQSPWKGFFKPVTNDKVFMSNLTVGTSVWKFRPTVNVVAQKYTLTGDSKVFSVGTLSAGGIGVSYEHFIDIDGVPYNNFGINGALLINTDILAEVPVSPCPYIGVQALQFLNLGVGYDLGVKRLFFALGASYSFN